MSSIEPLLKDLLALERPLLLALDVDGTLAPIVSDPDLAEIPAQTLSTLAALAEAPMLELALITGRDLSSLARMEQLQGVWRAVEHGGVVLAPGELPAQRQLTSEQRRALDRFREWVGEHARDAFIEHKPQAVAVHVRGIAANDPARAAQLLREADEMAKDLGLHVRRGKALREAEAVRHDKGNALREIFQRSRARSVFFAGDDLTDFPAIDFAAQHGVGAFVCSKEQRGRPSEMAAILHGVDDVAALLSELLHRLAG
ncbi:MAG: trehalose-phosphatase [Polyangiales bacterium]